MKKINKDSKIVYCKIDSVRFWNLFSLHPIYDDIPCDIIQIIELSGGWLLVE